MTLKKTDIAKSIRTQSGYSVNRATALLESTLEIIKERLSSGEDILISSFGKFFVKENNMRKGKSQVNGNHATPGAKRVVVFKWSHVLEKKLNRNGQTHSSTSTE